jgi:hypothetical protein
MKTFAEFAQGAPEKVSTSFPTFSDVKEGKLDTCMTEDLKTKINEMMEMCKEEMQLVHGDETPKTAESWMSECEAYMKECMESLQKECSECMIQKG